MASKTPNLDRYLDYLHGNSDVLAKGADDAAWYVTPEKENTQEQAAQDAHHLEHQIQQVVQNSLNFILSGNKAMYVPTDELAALKQALAQQVQQFRRHKQLNPNLPIAHLKQRIGVGSPFAMRYRRHFEHHHPDHQHTLEPGAQKSQAIVPGLRIQAGSAVYEGAVNEGIYHSYGAPPLH